jgi:hypothetical protein
MTKTRVLLAIFVLVVAVALTALAAIRATRPERPDLSNARQWSLIKIDRAASSPKEIRVYVAKHLSSTWDPYTVEQNKIAVFQDGKSLEFMWPSDREYAAGWCEIVRLPSGGVVVLLFESAESLRVVLFDHGQFVFRPDKDELFSATEIKYAGVNHDGIPEFVVTEADKRRTLRWTPEAGFAETPESRDHTKLEGEGSDRQSFAQIRTDTRTTPSNTATTR